jgi:hypothetical protein
MPPPTVLFYVSGHGYGHARRSAEVMRALRRLVPDVAVHARTSAPADIFSDLLASPASPSLIDLPIIENDALSIDWPRTLAIGAERLEHRHAVVLEEAAAVRHVGPSLVVSDVPFLAGDVAEALGVPCVAVTNFTWDWIYEPHAGSHLSGDRVVETARRSYRKMEALLQLPFGHPAPAFKEVIPVPLVARRGLLEREDVLSRLGILPADRRPRVLVAMRGGIPRDVLARAAADAPDFLFLTPQPRQLLASLPPNVVPACAVGDVDFSDLLAVSDVVLSKLGYGTIADAIAAGTRLLWPRREGFREDHVTQVEAPRYLRMAELPRDDFRAGRWRRALEQAMSLPPPTAKMSIQGAASCAAILTKRLAAVA